jgi:hypothetical protein
MFELVDAIKDLIATISGVPREIHVNTTYTESSTPPGDNGSTNHNAQGPDRVCGPWSSLEALLELSDPHASWSLN